MGNMLPPTKCSTLNEWIYYIFMPEKFQPPKITSPKEGASFHAAQGEVRSSWIKNVCCSLFISRAWASLALLLGIPTRRCAGVDEERPRFIGDLLITLIFWWLCCGIFVNTSACRARIMLLSQKVWRTDRFNNLVMNTVPLTSLLDI